MAFKERRQHQGDTYLTNGEVAWVMTGTGGVVEMTEGTTPSQIASTGLLYVKASDSNLYFLTSGGVELQLSPRLTGVSGVSGVSGVAGTNGACGVSGISGVSGTTGSAGQSFTWRGTWLIGTTYALDDVVFGSDSNDYISKQNTNLAHDPTLDVSHTWWDVFIIEGPVGPTGACGVSGHTGACGVSGVSGTASSVAGPAGACGVSGVSGVAGAGGACGVSGTAGTNGACGVSGTAGTAGACGVSGISGVTGVAGTNGACGVSGISGVSGVTGVSGVSGISGPVYPGTNNAITASGNAATVPVTYSLSTVTNNSAATLTITMTTTSAASGQLTIVRVLDATGVAQTISWVNTENSTVTAPTTSNGSTTLPLTVGFQFNNLTTKWRCIAVA
jgi:collagen type VII alpha